MKIFITGSTGFIGRALVLRLQRDGHRIVAWTRNEGEPLIGRWTSARRARIAASRVALTERLVTAMTSASRTPSVFVSGSAVGYYGDRGDELLTENSAPADDFLGHLCQGWEGAALRAEGAGRRVVLLRTGIVLGRDGGALAKLLTPFRLGLGGPIGSGKQYMPWIHLHDEVEIIARALVDERYRGAINGAAPDPVTNREFARALGRALHRPAFMPLPGFVLKAVMGAAASVLLGGQRATPKQLTSLGFTFAYPNIEAALSDIVVVGKGVDIQRVEAA